MNHTMMPKEQFIRGWDLLVTQPWGRRYGTVQDSAAAKAAATQLAFYYKKLGAFPAEIWVLACELFAQGDHWPSVDELRTTLNHNLPPRLQVEYSGGRAEIPEPIALCMAHAETHRTSLLEAMQTVLPDWIRTNPDHEDRPQAGALYDQIRTLKINQENGPHLAAAMSSAA